MGIIAEILRRHGSRPDAATRLPAAQRRALHRVTACRTGRLGGHAEYCLDCAELAEFIPHSCRDRLCPVCRGSEAHGWLQARQAETLPVRYFHVIVTVPTAYSLAVRDHPRRLGSEFMEGVAEALQALASGPHGPGGELGILAVLHTWGRNLAWHAHVHCLVPGVVLQAEDTFGLIRTRFLVPLCAFRKVFPAILTRRFRKVLKGFDPPGRVWRSPWNAEIRPCAEGPRIVLKYLTRYVRSGPLHESQIVQADDTQLAFRYLDHRSGTLQVWRGTPAVFVERYLQHALPHRFHRIRHYGFYAPGRRRDLRALQVAMLGRHAASALAPPPPPRRPPPQRPCPTSRPQDLRFYPPQHPDSPAAATPRGALRQRLEGPSGRQPMTRTRHTLSSLTRSAPRSSPRRSLASAKRSAGLPGPVGAQHRTPATPPPTPQTTIRALPPAPAASTVTPGGGIADPLRPRRPAPSREGRVQQGLCAG